MKKANALTVPPRHCIQAVVHKFHEAADNRHVLNLRIARCFGRLNGWILALTTLQAGKAQTATIPASTEHAAPMVSKFDDSNEC